MFDTGYGRYRVPLYTEICFTMDFLLLVRLCSFFFTKLIFVHYGVDDGGLVFTQERITKYTTEDGLIQNWRRISPKRK